MVTSRDPDVKRENNRLQMAIKYQVKKLETSGESKQIALATKVKDEILSLTPTQVRIFAKAWERCDKNFDGAFVRFEQHQKNVFQKIEKVIGKPMIFSQIEAELGNNSKAADNYCKYIQANHPKSPHRRNTVIFVCSV